MMNFELQEAKTSRHTLLTADNAANDILLTVPVGLECSAPVKAKGKVPFNLLIGRQACDGSSHVLCL